MALSDKNIVITPNISQTSDPQIVFSGADASTGPQNITLRIYPTNNGTLSFEGSAGQLFSINNSTTGTIFSANDVSGIPSIEVLDTGLVKLAQYGGNVLIGTGTDNASARLQVNGSVSSSSNFTGTQFISTVSTGNSPFVVTSTTQVNNLNAQYWQGYSFGNYLNQSVRTDSSPTFGDIYANNWFRNNSQYLGLYSQYHGNHWYASSDTYWNIAGNNASTVGIIFRTGGHQGSIRGYVYANSGNEIGFLNTSANWSFRVDNSGNSTSIGGLGVSNTDSTTGTGLSLYNGASSSIPTYGIIFGGTGTFGTHGNVSSDWATYFTMNDTANRGWIFRRIGSTSVNVASINNSGAAAFGQSGSNGGGSIIIYGSLGSMELIPSAGSSAAEIRSGTSNGVIIKANNTTVASISSTGIISSSNITAYGSPSDKNLKENIEPLTNSLEKVMQLQGVSYNWKKNTKEYTMVGIDKDIGLIAQNVQSVFPDLVREGEDGVLSLRDRGLIAVLIEAIKEQQIQINELKKALGK